MYKYCTHRAIDCVVELYYVGNQKCPYGYKFLRGTKFRCFRYALAPTKLNSQEIFLCHTHFFYTCTRV